METNYIVPPRHSWYLINVFLFLQITGSKRKADICIGLCRSCGEDTVMVSEQWVIGENNVHPTVACIRDHPLGNVPHTDPQ